jgi:hypothetical protein
VKLAYTALVSSLTSNTAYFGLLKAGLAVTVYGSYEQVLSGSLERLELLKRCLRDRGYSQARRVVDYPEPLIRAGEDDAAYAARKSTYWLDNSDVNIMVLFCRIPGGSLGVEMGWLAGAADVSQTIVLYEEECYDEFDTLLRGIPQFRKIEWDKFQSDEDLCIKSSKKALNVLHSP